jgi:putative methionine-R-sulfoxide reductase with GAF domain
MELSVESLKSIVGTLAPRPERAAAAARLIRSIGGYRWVGIYDVEATEISVIAWDGPEPPSFPRFPSIAD